MTTTTGEGWYLVTARPEEDTTYRSQDPGAVQDTSAYRVRWKHSRPWPHSFAIVVAYAAFHPELPDRYVVRLYGRWLVSTTTDDPELTALDAHEAWHDYPDPSRVYNFSAAAHVAARGVAYGLVDGTEEYIIAGTLDWDGFPE